MSGCVLRRELVLEGGGKQHVAVELEGGRPVGGRRRTGELQDRPCSPKMLAHAGRVEAPRVGDGAVVLGDGHDAGPGVVAALRRPVADLAESLDDDALAVDAGCEAQPPHVVGLGARLVQNVVEPPARRLDPPVDPPLRFRLPGHAPEGVDLVGMERLVGVGDPRHLPLARSVVGCGHVDGGADEVLAGQLVGVAPRDALELLDVVAARVDLNRALGAAERHLDDGALVGHQRGQRHHLVLVDLRAEAGAALDRQAVLAVLGPPGADHLHPAVALPHRKVEAVQAVAALDLVEQPGRIVGEGGGAVEVAADVGVEAPFGHRGCGRRGGVATPASRILSRGRRPRRCRLQMAELLLVVGLVLVTSAACSLFEAVLYSVPASHIEALDRAGRRSGRILKRHAAPGRPTDRGRAVAEHHRQHRRRGGGRSAGGQPVRRGRDPASRRSRWRSRWPSCCFSEVIPKTVGVVLRARSRAARGAPAPGCSSSSSGRSWR